MCFQAAHGCEKPSFNRARTEHGGSYSNEMVDGVIAVMRVIPVFILVIIYWAVYSQVNLPLSFIWIPIHIDTISMEEGGSFGGVRLFPSVCLVHIAQI